MTGTWALTRRSCSTPPATPGPPCGGTAGLSGAGARSDSGEVVLQPLEDVGAEGRRALENEAAQLTDWLDGVKVLPRFPSPLSKRLPTNEARRARRDPPAPPPARRPPPRPPRLLEARLLLVAPADDVEAPGPEVGVGADRKSTDRVPAQPLHLVRVHRDRHRRELAIAVVLVDRLGDGLEVLDFRGGHRPQRAAGRPASSRNGSIVFVRPSRSDTSGAQSSRSRARVMSGWRT